MNKHGMNMELVKIQNRSVILHCINDAGSISRKDIAERTGLTAAAVTLICNEFIRDKLIIEGESVKKEIGSGAGRRKVLISIDYKSNYFVAISIETDRTVIAITDMQGNPSKIEKIKTNKDCSPEEFLNQISECTKKLISECPNEVREKISIGAVSIPGIVDSENGKSIQAYGIWNDEVDVCDILKEKTGIPFVIENNVIAFARAEQVFATGKYKENVLVIKWGPGVGAANFIENQIYTGFRGRSAELGHFIVDPNGEQCVCGQRGCLETFVSAKALSEKNEKETEEAIDKFAITIANLARVLTPDRVILYGELAKDEKYQNMLKESAKKYYRNYTDKKMRYTKLENCEDFIGPVSVAIDVIFQGK